MTAVAEDAATVVQRDLPDRSQAVTIAYVHQNEVAYSWHHSMVEMIGYDMATNGRIMAGGYVSLRCGADGLVQARNKAVKHFLDDGRADWMFWVDTDMGFEPDTVDRLLEAADPIERPIVGALCFTQMETAEDSMGGWRCQATPTTYDWTKLDDGQMGWTVRWDFPPNTLMQVGGTGTACILVHRSVFERIETEHGRVWYDRVFNTTSGNLIGEDLSFCLRAGALQIPMFVHTGVRTTHLKSVWLSDEDFRYQQRSTSRAGRSPVDPATVETAVIVPVLNRPQNAEPFMTSLRASTGMATVYAVASHDDEMTAKAWQDAGAELITGPNRSGVEPAHTFAEKVNLGYANTTEPWLFIVGDDVRFHPGWLDQAQALAGDRYHVIGTNDLGNPRVTSGQHSTHLLIRREYVDEQGASWDGPKVVAHEGYRHCFVDDEIVTVAKQRRVWAMALGSVVEHLHPAWGKAESDEVYQVGMDSLTADREIFELRAAGNLR